MRQNNFLLYSYFLDLHKIIVVVFIGFLYQNNEIEKRVFLKISDLIYVYVVIRTEIFQETYFSFYFIASTIEYSLKRCCIMMRI